MSFISKLNSLILRPPSLYIWRYQKVLWIVLWFEDYLILDLDLHQDINLPQLSQKFKFEINFSPQLSQNLVVFTLLIESRELSDLS